MFQITSTWIRHHTNHHRHHHHLYPSSKSSLSYIQNTNAIKYKNHLSSRNKSFHKNSDSLPNHLNTISSPSSPSNGILLSLGYRYYHIPEHRKYSSLLSLPKDSFHSLSTATYTLHRNITSFVPSHVPSQTPQRVALHRVARRFYRDDHSQQHDHHDKEDDGPHVFRSNSEAIRATIFMLIEPLIRFLFNPELWFLALMFLIVILFSEDTRSVLDSIHDTKKLIKQLKVPEATYSDEEYDTQYHNIVQFLFSPENTAQVGVLLGPSGCGKTSLARQALADQWEQRQQSVVSPLSSSSSSSSSSPSREFMHIDALLLRKSADVHNALRRVENMLHKTSNCAIVIDHVSPNHLQMSQYHANALFVQDANRYLHHSNGGDHLPDNDDNGDGNALDASGNHNLSSGFINNVLDISSASDDVKILLIPRSDFDFTYNQLLPEIYNLSESIQCIYASFPNRKKELRSFLEHSVDAENKPSLDSASLGRMAGTAIHKNISKSKRKKTMNKIVKRCQGDLGMMHYFAKHYNFEAWNESDTYIEMTAAKSRSANPAVQLMRKRLRMIQQTDPACYAAVMRSVRRLLKGENSSQVLKEEDKLFTSRHRNGGRDDDVDDADASLYLNSSESDGFDFGFSFGDDDEENDSDLNRNNKYDAKNISSSSSSSSSLGTVPISQRHDVSLAMLLRSLNILELPDPNAVAGDGDIQHGDMEHRRNDGTDDFDDEETVLMVSGRKGNIVQKKPKKKPIQDNDPRLPRYGPFYSPAIRDALESMDAEQ